MFRDRVFILTWPQEPKGTTVTEIQLVFYQVSELEKSRTYYVSEEILASFTIKIHK